MLVRGCGVRYTCPKENRLTFGFKKRRRRRWRSQPLPEAWLAIIERNVPYYRHLNAEERRELQGHIQVFLHEKRFEGAGGLEITNEIRVTVAAQACILLLNRESDYFPLMKTIFVYPQPYVARMSERLPGGLVREGVQARLGESWQRGPVVLSWDDVLHGARDPNDGHNVVFHEFAHELDGEFGPVDGAPRLPNNTMYTAWARVLGQEYNELLKDLQLGHRRLIDSYGATSPGEFFAVVTELFFEKPLALKARHPQLYEQFRLFYMQDPAARVGSRGEGTEG
jgi:Mlc titration factor MtfA (ptsG expression regulator)